MRHAAENRIHVLLWGLLAAAALVNGNANSAALTSGGCEGVRDAQEVNDALASSSGPSVDLCLDSANAGCVFQCASCHVHVQ